jgi:anthranilate phosphoribosyltransferase
MTRTMPAAPIAGANSPLRDILLKLCRREDLTRDEARDAFAQIMSGGASDAQIGGLLVGLASKGTTVEELVGAATVMREKTLEIPIEDLDDLEGAAPNGARDVILDTCGTGGDVRATFNISTAAAIIAAAAGVRVVKHGNRSASGRIGSADVLEKLGLRLELRPEQLRRCLDQTSICFAFARYHHPAMQFVAAARSSLGIPTIFNLLGPLTNPGRAKHQLLGVFAPELTDRLATVLREMGSSRAWVVHAEDGLDELSTLGPTRVSELKDGRVTTWTLDPRDLGLGYARLSDLQIATMDDAVAALRGAIENEPGPRRDIAILNAAGALVVAGTCADLAQGMARAQSALDDGRAANTLHALIECSNS